MLLLLTPSRGWSVDYRSLRTMHVIFTLSARRSLASPCSKSTTPLPQARANVSAEALGLPRRRRLPYGASGSTGMV